MEYEFSFRFKLPADAPPPEELVERLGAAGCDDAVVGTGQPGRIALQFSRHGKSADHAMLSALRDVKRALPGVELIEAGPDMVGLSDIAELLGVSRQNMRKLWLSHPASFPAPMHDGSAALWRLAPVLRWLEERGQRPIERRLVEVAQAAMHMNLAGAVARHDPRTDKRLQALLS
jgi:hypothetical protein